MPVNNEKLWFLANISAKNGYRANLIGSLKINPYYKQPTAFCRKAHIEHYRQYSRSYSIISLNICKIKRKILSRELCHNVMFLHSATRKWDYYTNELVKIDLKRGKIRNWCFEEAAIWVHLRSSSFHL